ncbi:MAG: hypothetical protein BWK73_19155 [Thiothrix lacustris]|uniref:Uncharacterized protein n=1 Tax=Thiothrix lacustris TaxID=525917 RepID=A0A1Y1QQ35_9GAMM|nr:MAG: hypothetical protein BWK73_19155 [Thiothrix lacustris]
MSYFLNGKAYPNLPIALAENDRDAAGELPDAQYVNDVFPMHDPDWQNVQWQKIDNVWQLIVVDKPLRARIDPVTNAVVELHPTGFVIESLSALDNLSDDQKNLYFDWEENGYDVPLQLRRHIRVGWLHGGDSFEPPSVSSLLDEAKESSRAIAENFRQLYAKPTGNTEVGLWAVVATGMMFRDAGLPAPAWERMLTIEAFARGITVEALRTEQIARAQAYLDLGALSQGMAKHARDAFVGAGTVDGIVAKSDQFRAQAAAAIANPVAVITELLQQG